MKAAKSYRLPWYLTQFYAFHRAMHGLFTHKKVDVALRVSAIEQVRDTCKYITIVYNHLSLTCLIVNNISKLP